MVGLYIMKWWKRKYTVYIFLFTFDFLLKWNLEKPMGALSKRNCICPRSFQSCLQNIHLREATKQRKTALPAWLKEGGGTIITTNTVGRWLHVTNNNSNEKNNIAVNFSSLFPLFCLFAFSSFASFSVWLSSASSLSHVFVK